MKKNNVGIVDNERTHFSLHRTLFAVTRASVGEDSEGKGYSFSALFFSFYGRLGYLETELKAKKTSSLFNSIKF